MDALVTRVTTASRDELEVERARCVVLDGEEPAVVLVRRAQRLPFSTLFEFERAALAMRLRENVDLAEPIGALLPRSVLQRGQGRDRSSCSLGI